MYITGLMPPDQPDIYISFQPSIEFIDYLTLIVSCVSFWLGFSPFSFLLSVKISKSIFKSSRNNDRGQNLEMIDNNQVVKRNDLNALESKLRFFVLASIERKMNNLKIIGKE